MIILSGTICHAQLPAPCQIDTLIITCIRYNYDEIDRVNWPFSVIYKSTTFFKFAETKFVIQDITKLGDEIYFTVVNSLENTYGQEEYSLVYRSVNEPCGILNIGGVWRFKKNAFGNHDSEKARTMIAIDI